MMTGIYLLVGEGSAGTAVEGDAIMAERFARKTKKAAHPPRTNTTTMSKEKMPAFIPLARSESDFPKQVAQADADDGSEARTKAKQPLNRGVNRNNRLISN